MTSLTLSLRGWMKGALKGEDEPPSPPCLKSSIRIAIHLAQQIHEAEELSNVGLSSGLESLPSCSPGSPLLAESVTVGVSRIDDPIPLWSSSRGTSSAENQVAAAGSDEVDLDGDDTAFVRGYQGAHLNPPNNNIIEGENTFESSDVDEDYIDYHDIKFAQIDAESRNSVINTVDEERNKQHRIYSLGLVFYELFSGSPPHESFAKDLRGELVNLSIESSESHPYKRRSTSQGSRSSHTRRSSDETFELGCRSSLDSHGQVIHDLSCIENLRIRGVPYPLCDLIQNMIDSVNGEFMSNESYVNMSDVICDLQLMLDRPEIFLHGIDTTRQTGLELDDETVLFQRDAEFQFLQDSYERAVLGSAELAIIKGLSGTGKTTLAKRFGDFVSSTHKGYFLMGKFDQLEQAGSFSAIASALNKYIDLLLEGEDLNRDRLEILSSKLRLTLGQDICYLTSVLPSLSKIVDDLGSSTHSDDCVNAQQRLNYLLCRFISVICSFSEDSPIVMFLDDVHWADSYSIALIGQILKAGDTHQLFILCSCREDQMKDHPLWDTLQIASSHGYKVTQARLDCINNNELKEVLSHLLRITPRLIHNFSEIIYQKTKGNPLFVTRLLVSLHKEGLLRINLARHRWEWDEEAMVSSRELSDDVVTFFVQCISSLPADANAALGTLSCFGNSTSCEVIEALEGTLGLKLLDPLDIVIREGLVSKRNGEYLISHDRIQEVAYSMMSDHECKSNHMKYGICLMEMAVRKGDNALLFTAMTQINIGGPSAVFDTDHYAVIAENNLLAGKIVMTEFSDFSKAFSYFDNGISFLRKNHWREQYNLSLELHNLAAKCSLTIKDYTSLTIICNTVWRNAKGFEDKLEVSLITMSFLIHSKIAESVGYGIASLRKIDVIISESTSQDDILEKLSQTKAMLHEVSDDTILSKQTMSEYKSLTAMSFLARLIFSVQIVKPSLLPLVTMQMISLTMDGLSPMSAVGFAYFSAMVSGLGDFQEGHRFAKLAMLLLDKFGNNKYSGQVLSVCANVLSYIEPFQVVKEYWVRGEKAAMASGDICWACLNRVNFALALFLSGSNLSVVREECEKASQFAEGNVVASFYIQNLTYFISHVVGGLEVVRDDVIEGNLVHSAAALQFFLLSKLYLALIFNDLGNMSLIAHKYSDITSRPLFLHAGYLNQPFLCALVCYRMFRVTHDSVWMERARVHHRDTDSWSENGSVWNFGHKCSLLQAEEMYSTGDSKRAQDFYDSAISCARQSKFIIDEALSSELAANFYLDSGDKSNAFHYYSIAHSKYLEWGALSKVAKLNTLAEETFGISFAPVNFHKKFGP